MLYCSYFQASVKKKETWFFVATLRSYEHHSFDRTLDKNTGTFEIFVPEKYEECFVQLMSWYQEQGVVTEFKKLPNRLKDSTQEL